jgi:hypothetical protein
MIAGVQIQAIADLDHPKPFGATRFFNFEVHDNPLFMA